MNGEFLYKKVKLGQIDKSQLTDREKGELYKYMVDSKRISSEMIKPEVAQKYSIPTPPMKNAPTPQTTDTPIFKTNTTPIKFQVSSALLHVIFIIKAPKLVIS